MNKEHIYPQWLLKRTKCVKDIFTTPYGNIPADNFTAPLCEECNLRLGSELEKPVAGIFERIESGKGFNDYEAELLIRWMWKITSLFYWSICNEHWKYGPAKLIERTLGKIEQPRSRLSLGIALIDDADEEYGCSPIGLDDFTFYSNVYTVGVFSHICIVVFLSRFVDYIDTNIWTTYQLSNFPLLMNPNKKILPRVSFLTGSEAISTVKKTLGNKSLIHVQHEKFAEQQIKMLNGSVSSKSGTTNSLNEK